ncbi:MAG: sodium:solute symporter family protein [Candidatus Latescibacteria bacterium]|nr:sodium:solute symporter family protein [Candidatus Latescibacterota bacterium]
MNFTLLDWIIVVIYLIFTISVGLYAKRFVSDLSGYIVAGRRLKIGAGTATMIATELGTVTIMYMGESGYRNGFSALVLGIIMFVVYFLVGHTGFIIGGLRKLRVMTVPEFYDMKYNRSVRILGGFVLFVGGVLNMGVFLKLDGVFLSNAMGFGDNAVALIMVIMLFIVGMYTIFGGMISVVVTDYLQFTVLSVSMLLTTIFAFRAVSIPQITETITHNLGPGGFNPFTNTDLGWVFIVWMLITNFAAAALWQPGTTRALSAESPETGKRVFKLASVTFAGRAMIPMMWGIIALTMFPGLTEDSAISAAMPRMLGQVLPTGIIGMLIAGMLAASMSTYSSYLLAFASVITRDVIWALSKETLSEKTLMTITRVWVGLIGLFLLVFGLLYKIPASSLKYIFITGNMYTAGAVSAVGFGLYWKKANNIGAYASLITGAAAPLAFLLLTNFKEQLPSFIKWIANPNIAGFLSFGLGAIGMVAGSLITQRISPPKDLTPYFDKGD